MFWECLLKECLEEVPVLDILTPTSDRTLTAFSGRLEHVPTSSVPLTHLP